MKEVEVLVYQRMVADTGSGGLVTLLGSATRILHAYQVATPPSPGITFGILSAVRGQIPRLTRELFVNFHIFAQNYTDYATRLMRLFDHHQHDLALIAGGAIAIGGVESVFDFEGPDGFDDQLQVQTKDLRFRFFVRLKAQGPI